MPNEKPLKLAILWHMHQPNYQEPGSARMVLPWVRLHATKDYLDMLLLAGRYENLKVTFNLVPSLIDQFQLYIDGGTDPHLELSRIAAADLTPKQKREILGSFFSANQTHMIEPYERYLELYRKCGGNSEQPVLSELFSNEEMRDLQTWSNLVWVDPMFRSEEPVKALFDQGRHFSEQQKHALLDWQIDLIGRVMPAHQDLFAQGRVDISFSPYYHPILPLLCDTRVALEAMPNMELPGRSFRHPEDAEAQIRMSIQKFESIFGTQMAGMWPSEGSVSEEVADILIRMGIKWIATDEGILHHSLSRSGLDRAANPIHTVYEYGPGLKLFFRDHALSDRIGFVYSGWDADRSVSDFVGHLKRIRSLCLDRIDQAVVPVILDGENAWEYFPDDGHEFLSELYRHLDEDPLIETVTMSEAAADIEPRQLKALFAGSWINHSFRIWIGHPEDNEAWDLLAEARDTLVEFEAGNPDFSREQIEAAWKQVLIAEGSDWCWWYGDEHRNSGNEQFDRIFRGHLASVYELLGLEPPFRLQRPIYRAGPSLKAVQPDALLTPKIDGRLTHFYEWAGAGYFDCLRAGGAMHRVDNCISRIHFGFDHQRFYIRLDFVNRNSLDLIKSPLFEFVFLTPEPLHLVIDASGARTDGPAVGHYEFCLGESLELAVERKWLWSREHGSLGLAVTLRDGQSVVESWPESEPIKLDVAQKNKEMFWPT